MGIVELHSLPKTMIMGPNITLELNSVRTFHSTYKYSFWFTIVLVSVKWSTTYSY